MHRCIDASQKRNPSYVSKKASRRKSQELDADADGAEERGSKRAKHADAAAAAAAAPETPVQKLARELTEKAALSRKKRIAAEKAEKVAARAQAEAQGAQAEASRRRMPRG